MEFNFLLFSTEKWKWMSTVAMDVPAKEKQVMQSYHADLLDPFELRQSFTSLQKLKVLTSIIL